RVDHPSLERAACPSFDPAERIERSIERGRSSLRIEQRRRRFEGNRASLCGEVAQCIGDRFVGRVRSATVQERTKRLLRTFPTALTESARDDRAWIEGITRGVIAERG